MAAPQCTVLLQQPKSLQKIAVNTLSLYIKTHICNLSIEAEELIKDPSEAEDALSEQADFIRERIECNAPRMFHNKLLRTTIKSLHQLLEETDVNLFARVMVESLFTKYVTTLSLNYDNFVMFQNSLVSKAFLLTGLESLSMFFESTKPRHISTEVKDNIVSTLIQLPYLKSLNLSIVHTDKILKCVVENCPFLEELVLGVNSVSDDTVSMLTRLRNLKRITFSTSITDDAIEMLLVSCNDMELIDIVCDNSKLAKVITDIAASSEKKDKKYNLKIFNSGDNTVDELRMAVRKCPLIEDMTIYPTSRSNYSRDNILMAITDLHGLQELKLFGIDFYRGQVSKALQVIGCHLVYLELTGIIELDLNAIIDISQMCPNLRTLTSKQCKFGLQAGKQKAIKIPPFAKLENLHLDLRNSFPCLNLYLITPEHLELLHASIFFILSNCLNVEYVDVNVPSWLSDEILMRVIEKNPLTKLRRITLWHRMRKQRVPLFVDQLIKNCVNHPEVLMYYYST